MRRQRMRFVLITALALVLIAATLPALVRQLYPPLPPVAGGDDPAAVVVLGAGRRPAGEGYAPNATGLRRLHLGLGEARRRGLPLLLSGGASGRTPARQANSEASLLASEARRLAPDIALMLEPESRNTWENATLSAALLREKGIDRVVLVTDRAHMPRAMLCFQAQGIRVTPVSVPAIPDPAWLPSAAALSQVPLIWREWLALLWYHVKYGV
ncbi:YdcF family protein [Alloalcanivorax mobilis]|uniref:YdcF family protein n=1 Tax=Alloalcanivorax mobilis TaxID=2019569 RepID=UPI001E410353|nr:YdcF family protein [Alloalcanivorax mobilis]